LAQAAVLGLALLLSACSNDVEYRGYLPRAGDLQRVQTGMSKAEIEALLGSPSTSATVRYSGDSYYYISSTVQQRAFFTPVETDRRVFAVRFDVNDRVESFANYGLEDGRIINISTRETPTRGRELTVLQQIFGNIGNFTPNSTPPGQGQVGPGPF
jgi:outer membrane protein assembly factor BamE (lipoprotein component of BamABCDE complex)